MHYPVTVPVKQENRIWNWQKCKIFLHADSRNTSYLQYYFCLQSLPDILSPKDIAEQEERQAADRLGARACFFAKISHVKGLFYLKFINKWYHLDRSISERLSKMATTARRGSRSPWSFHPPPATQGANSKDILDA